MRKQLDRWAATTRDRGNLLVDEFLIYIILVYLLIIFLFTVHMQRMSHGFIIELEQARLGRAAPRSRRENDKDRKMHQHSEALQLDRIGVRELLQLNSNQFATPQLPVSKIIMLFDNIPC